MIKRQILILSGLVGLASIIAYFVIAPTPQESQNNRPFNRARLITSDAPHAVLDARTKSEINSRILSACIKLTSHSKQRHIYQTHESIPFRQEAEAQMLQYAKGAQQDYQVAYQTLADYEHNIPSKNLKNYDNLMASFKAKINQIAENPTSSLSALTISSGILDIKPSTTHLC